MGRQAVDHKEHTGMRAAWDWLSRKEWLPAKWRIVGSMTGGIFTVCVTTKSGNLTFYKNGKLKTKVIEEMKYQTAIRFLEEYAREQLEAEGQYVMAAPTEPEPSRTEEKQQFTRRRLSATRMHAAHRQLLRQVRAARARSISRLASTAAENP